MIRLIISILFIVSAGLNSYGQDKLDLMTDMENNILQIRQNAGTDSILANLLKSAKIEEDTVYAFMYRPGDCPRCEAGFKTFRKLLHERGKKFTLISVFKNAAVSDYYNKMKGYEADYYINDTTDVCLQIFSFNNIPLDGSNVLKMTKSGRLITGGEYTILSKSFVDQLIKKNQPLAYHTYNNDSKIENCLDNNNYKPAIIEADDTIRFVKTYPLKTDGIPMCAINRAPLWKNSTLICPDDVLNAVFVFRENEHKQCMEFDKLLDVEGDYKNQFITIEENLKNSYEQRGMLFYILCDADIDDNGDILISASLPLVKYMDEKKEEVGLFNQPCIIRHFSDRIRKEEVIPLEFNLFKDDYSTNTFRFQP